jgi:hypothetical protein
MTSIYVLYGWRVSTGAAAKLLTTPEIQEDGMQVVMAAGSTDLYLGELLLKYKVTDKPGGVAPPGPEVAARMKMSLERNGLEKLTTESPLVWVVIG